jgi:hypothetical protein
VGQHGLSPERLWALIAIAAAVAYGVAYWAGLARGFRGGWAERLRRANLHLAAVTCVLALILALPLVDFGGVSARNQIARLDRGAVSAEDFDYTALRWDFGDAGRRTLAGLAERDGVVGEKAKAAEVQTSRPYDYSLPMGPAHAPGALRVQPDDPALRAVVEKHLDANPWQCSSACVALEDGRDGAGNRRVILATEDGWQRLIFAADGSLVQPAPAVAPAADNRDLEVEIREETARYVYINGQRVGQPLD